MAFTGLTQLASRGGGRGRVPTGRSRRKKEGGATDRAEAAAIRAQTRFLRSDEGQKLQRRQLNREYEIERNKGRLGFAQVKSAERIAGEEQRASLGLEKLKMGESRRIEAKGDRQSKLLGRYNIAKSRSEELGPALSRTDLEASKRSFIEDNPDIELLRQLDEKRSSYGEGMSGAQAKVIGNLYEQLQAGERPESGRYADEDFSTDWGYSGPGSGYYNSSPLELNTVLDKARRQIGKSTKAKQTGHRDVLRKEKEKRRAKYKLKVAERNLYR